MRTYVNTYKKMQLQNVKTVTPIDVSYPQQRRLLILANAKTVFNRRVSQYEFKKS